MTSPTGYHLSLLFLGALFLQPLDASSPAPELARSIGTTPIQYGPREQEAELFGYRPAFDPGVVTFDAANRPWLRQWTTRRNPMPRLQTIDETGSWTLSDYYKALPADFKPGPWQSLSDTELTFDREGDAYLLVDGAADETGSWWLLHSRDGAKTWTPHRLPFGPLPGDFKGRTTNGGRAILESNTRAGFLEHPPVIMANDETHLLLLVPTKNPDGSLRIPAPQKVVDVTGDSAVRFDESWKAGWGGVGHDTHRKIASFGDHVFFVWARPVRPNAHPGTPMYIAHYRRSTGALAGDPVYLGSNGVEVDSHNQPVIALDSRGLIHVILGAHGTLENPHETLLYTASRKPLDISSFTTPERLPAAGCTYPFMVVDSRDTLHLVSRKYDTYAFVTPDTYAQGSAISRDTRPGEGFDLAPRSRLQYFRKPHDGAWSTRSLVVTWFGSYVFWHNRITLDTRDRLFVSYYHSTRALQATRPDKPSLLYSADGGDTWELATTPVLDPAARDRTGASPQAAPAGRLVELPIRYEEGRGERELLGYSPGFTPNLASHSPDGTPFVLTWTGNKRRIPSIQFRDASGRWETLPGPALPEGFELGPFARMSDVPLVFDRDGDAYLLIDGTGRPDGRWLLAHSRDAGRTWKVYPTPLGPMPGKYKGLPAHSANRAIIEFPGTPLRGGYPPVILGNDDRHLLLVSPVKTPGGDLVFPEPARIASVAGDSEVPVPSESHEGFGGFHHNMDRPVVSTGDLVHVAYIRPVPHGAAPGTPTWITTYDRRSGRVGEPVFLGHAGIEIDSHNRPQLLADSRGLLHVILGAHGGRLGQHLTYRRALRPGSAEAWSEPVALAPGLTYPAAIFDQADNLHVFARSHEGDFTYDRKPAGSDAWEPRRQVIVPKTRLGYHLYNHNVSLAPDGSLWVDYLSSTRERGPATATRKSESHGPNLLRSSDRGQSWELVE